MVEEKRRDLMVAFANLITSKLNHEEIDMLCIALLHANMIVKQKAGESIAVSKTSNEHYGTQQRDVHTS